MPAEFLRNEPRPALPDDFADRVMARLETPAHSRARLRRRVAACWSAVTAASLTVLAFTGLPQLPAWLLASAIPASFTLTLLIHPRVLRLRP